MFAACHLTAMDESIDVIAGGDSRAVFVGLLKDNNVVLNKSMVPKIASAKEKAWACLAKQFSEKIGKETNVAQLKKLLNNMKTAVKKKSDVNATGNKPIKLLSWESDFLKIVESNENPVYCKIPGAVCIGLGASGTSTTFYEVEDESEDVLPLHQTVTEDKIITPKAKKNKKLKLCAETEETSNLTTGELQRLLLLEQIKLTRLQSQHEQMKIEELERRAKKHEIKVKMPEGIDPNIVVVEEQNVLKEFLLLK